MRVGREKRSLRQGVHPEAGQRESCHLRAQHSLLKHHSVRHPLTRGQDRLRNQENRRQPEDQNLRGFPGKNFEAQDGSFVQMLFDVYQFRQGRFKIRFIYRSLRLVGYLWTFNGE